MNKGRRRILFAVGVLFLLLAFAWRFIIVPEILQSFEDGRDGKGNGGEFTVLEGKLGLLKLVDDELRKEKDEGKENKSVSPLTNLTRESFELVWRNIEIGSYGIRYADSGEIIFEEEKNRTEKVESGKRKFFPLFGVEKKSYRIWNDAINDTVKARYVKESEIRGVKTYIYEVSIENYELRNIEREKAMGEGPILYNEHTRWWIAVETSIPIYLDTDALTSIIFPDFKKLWVEEGEWITLSDGRIWASDSNGVTGEEKNVTREEHNNVSLLDDDHNIAIFETWTVLYDKETGEPLDDEYQDSTHYIFAVDRTTFQYVEGIGNTERKGYYTFPWGNLEKRDYLMWDMVLDMQGVAEFKGEEKRHGVNTYLYEIREENVPIDDPNMILPIEETYGYDYYYDGFIRYWVEIESGIIIDVHINGTISMVPGTYAYNPILDEPIYKRDVGSLDFTFPNDTVELMKAIAVLFVDVLFPLSNTNLPVFALQVHFSDEMTEKMVELNNILSSILRILRWYIPALLAIAGTVPILIVTYKVRRSHVLA